MKNYIFYAHAGSGNHGCEAIVRSSIEILGREVKLYSSNSDQDKQYGINRIVDTLYEVSDKPLERYKLPWLVSRIQTKLTHSINKEIFYRKYDMLSQVKKGDIWFSIGGDNYCYPGTEILAAERNNIQIKKGKAVLWGCSVEPELLQNKEIADDLASYDLITARETISYEALKSVNQNTILVSDPAFTLKSKALPLPSDWKNDNMVGINISPLVLDSAKDSSLAFTAVRNLVRYILTNTDFGVVLIPHVVWKSNNDLLPLSQLYKEFSKTKRVLLLKDYNCMELKGFISRCRLFVGARTHATIAAYSSCVPTIVMGYSVKSKGIAVDLFGTDKMYVLPIQQLKNSNELVKRFEWLLENEKDIKQHLEQIMPEYINRAYLARNAVEQI